MLAVQSQVICASLFHRLHMTKFCNLTWRKSRRGVKLITQLHLALSLGMRGAVPLIPYMPLWIVRLCLHLPIRPKTQKILAL